jgi:hypothetical protein
MDEGIEPIYPRHQVMVPHEEVLNMYLPENMQALLDFNQLECMLPGNVDSSFLKCNSRKSSTKLIRLYGVQLTVRTNCCKAPVLPSKSEPSTRLLPGTETSAEPY